MSVEPVPWSWIPAAAVPPTSVAIGVGVAVAVAVPPTWWFVRLGRLSVWAAMGVIMAALGAVGLVFGRVRGAAEIGLPLAGGLGAAAGLGLYLATAGFMFVAVRWPPLRRQAHRIYDLRGERSLPATLAVACLAVAPGEEIVWRGLVQPLLGGWLGPLAGAVAAWGMYVAVNASSASLPIVLGAVVGGAAWSALALATGGVVAPILCHAVWTGLMLAVPPVFDRR